MIKTNSLLNLLAALLFTNYLILRPILKYLEYVYGFLRVNITFIALILLVLYLLVVCVFFFINSRKSVKKDFVLPVILLLWILLIQIVSIPILLTSYNINFNLVLKYTAMTFIGYFSFFLIGIHIDAIGGNRKFLYIAWLILTAFFFHYFLFSFLTNSSLFVYLNNQQIYLMLADSYALVSLIVLAISEKQWLKLILFLISAFILFTLVSRTSFYFYLVTSFVYFFVMYRKIFLYIVILMTISLGYFHEDIIDLLGPNNRMIRIFTGYDSSKYHREQLKKDNRKNASIDRIVWGTFMCDVIDFHTSGCYVHSYESFLYSFGIFPFVLFLALLLYVYMYLFLKISFLKTNFILQMIFLLTLFLTLEISFSRSYLSPYIWMIIGSIHNFKKLQRGVIYESNANTDLK